jgi:broad specificity phosphatase PhoE/N-acetylglutamate synthase-like GNAT family acetyltransferase
VKENRLVSTVITDEDVRTAIEDTGRGWVVDKDGDVVAFAIVNAATGNIWALFVRPEVEGRGFGRQLHDTMVDWLWTAGLDRLWLTTEPGTRAQRFYEKAGWRLTGTTDRGELRYELSRDSKLTWVFETHATTVDNEAGLASGWFDAVLSAAGEQQARALGARRRADDLTAVFCSDLTRSFRTAEIAFGDRSLPIVRDARLRECDYGDLTRRPMSEIEPQRLRHLVEPFPNGESYQEVVERVSGWLGDVRRQFDASRVMIIGHRATFYALQHLLNRVALREAVELPWTWQPGWTYELHPESDHTSS